MPPRPSPPPRLAAAERRYRTLTRRVAAIGLIAPGSVVHRYTHCGRPGCHCHADPPRLHGPYWQWSAQIDGKTVTRRLTEGQARRYREWVANDRRLRELITELRRAAAAAIDCILEAERPEAATRTPSRSRG